MALITITDLQSELNIDLTDCNGQALAPSLIAAAIAFAQGSRGAGYVLEQTADLVAYYEGGYSQFWLPTRAPVSAVSVATYNTVTSDYDAIDSAYVRWAPTREVSVSVALPAGSRAAGPAASGSPPFRGARPSAGTRRTSVRSRGWNYATAALTAPSW